ncbi:hypothetical protein D0A36_03690 [Xanthomonas campestris]|nr:hypothetical protein D0A36_03690 [Xanthomonas campestris]
MDRRRSSGLGGDAGEAGGARVGLIRESGIGNRESGIGNRKSVRPGRIARNHLMLQSAFF